MAAEVSSSEKSKAALFTRDLLGGCSSSFLGSKELDLDLQVPNGWEKRLDLKSGKIYLKRCNSPISSSSSSDQQQQQKKKKQSRMIQDLNFPPSTTTTTAMKNNNLLKESCLLDLKLVPSYEFQSSSVCTLDKVKSALERAEKESSIIITKKRLSSSSSSVVVAAADGSSSSCSFSSSPSLVKEDEEEEEEEEEEEKKSCSSSTNSSTSSSGLLFAAGCPGCLYYVLISKSNPKCPRCDSIVPSPVVKKPRIDLNSLSF